MQVRLIQAKIDYMQAGVKESKGKIDYPSFNMSVKKKQIIAPAGYILEGTWWIINKLFVVQE